MGIYTYHEMGGDTVIPKDLKERTKIGNVVATYHFDDKYGKSTIQVCDDFCRNTTKEEVEKILERIGRKSTEICVQWLQEKQVS